MWRVYHLVTPSALVTCHLYYHIMLLLGLSPSARGCVNHVSHHATLSSPFSPSALVMCFLYITWGVYLPSAHIVCYDTMSLLDSLYLVLEIIESSHHVLDPFYLAWPFFSHMMILGGLAQGPFDPQYAYLRRLLDSMPLFMEDVDYYIHGWHFLPSFMRRGGLFYLSLTYSLYSMECGGFFS